MTTTVASGRTPLNVQNSSFSKQRNWWEHIRQFSRRWPTEDEFHEVVRREIRNTIKKLESYLEANICLVKSSG